MIVFVPVLAVLAAGFLALVANMVTGLDRLPEPAQRSPMIKEAQLFAQKDLVNDLDLVVTAPDGREYNGMILSPLLIIRWTHPIIYIRCASRSRCQERTS